MYIKPLKIPAIVSIALTLFEIAKSAIIAMADKLPAPKKMAQDLLLCFGMNALSNMGYLITHSTMQGLGLGNNK
ncbi:hypothetical protein ACFLSK_03235 [Chloroflexota bacterium]